MRERFFRLDDRSIISGDWGDYGYILQHGITAHLARIEGRLALERAGPFIPPITFPGIGSILLTEEARSMLASSGLLGFSFRLVEKKLIVRLNWELWDLTAPEPPVYPEEGEPENYILGHEHCEKAAAALGLIWELVVPRTAKVTSRKPDTFGNSTDFRVDSSTWDGSDVFRSTTTGGTYLADRARLWFTDHWNEFVSFQECSTD